MNHYSHADAEIVLCAVEQSGWVVVKLHSPNINSIVHTNVDTATKCARKSGLAASKICRARARNDGDTKVVAEVHAITRVRSADERMSEWLERSFRGVVFDLNASQEVKDARINVYGVGGGSNRNCPVFEVSGKIKLHSNIS